jgi:hypothetical protein
MSGRRLRSGLPSTSSTLGKARRREHHHVDWQARLHDAPARVIRTNWRTPFQEGGGVFWGPQGTPDPAAGRRPLRGDNG